MIFYLYNDRDELLSAKIKGEHRKAIVITITKKLLKKQKTIEEIIEIAKFTTE